MIELSELRFYVPPTGHRIGQFRDVIPSQSLGLVLKKPIPTQQNQATQE